MVTVVAVDAGADSVAVNVAIPEAFSAMVVDPDNVTVIGLQFSVYSNNSFVLNIGQPGTATEYSTSTVVLPVPLNVTTVPFKEAGPDTKLSIPPGGSGIKSTEEPLQYKPFAPKVGDPEIETSKFVAPQIKTTAVAKE